MTIPAVMPGTNARGLDIFDVENDPAELAIVKYPPFDKGIPVVAFDRLVQSQSELVGRIFRTAGVSKDDFATYYEPAIINLARHLHLLPATSTTYFRGTGGLFRMSLEVALHSLQAANASVFPSVGGVERRFVMQPKWCLAAFLAGLCSQTYRALNSMVVMTRDNQQWAPLLEHLYDWCSDKNIDAYFVRWMDENHVHGAQASSAYAVSRIIPHDILQYLAKDNNQVVQAMTAAISGVETNASENPISRLVAPVITRVIEEDLQRTATNYGHLVIGAHLEPHLIDSMRRLVRGGKWIPNNVASGGRLWIGQEGIFLDWQSASVDISNLMARDAFAGVPKDPDTLADLLSKANLLESPPRASGRYWTITLPVTCESKDGMVKLRQGATILPNGFDMTPFENIQLILSATPKELTKANAATATHPNPKSPTDATTSAQPKVTPAQTSKSQASEKPPIEEATSHPRKEGAPHADEHASPRPKKSKSPPQDESTQNAPADEHKSRRKGSASAHEAFPENTSRLLASLKDTNAWLLSEILKAHASGKLTGRIVPLPHGTGISHEELSAHGIPVMELLEELALKGWLWVDKTRASRRIHLTQVDDQSVRVVILKPDIAAGLGLPVHGG